CMMTKYNMWFYEFTEKEIKQPKKFYPKIQKIIIHTLTDVFNSVLEIAAQKTGNRIYDIVSTKFFSKLENTFNNQTVIENFELLYKKETDYTKKDFTLIKVEDLKLDGKQYREKYGISKYRICKAAKYYPSRISRSDPDYNYNNVSNCLTGY